VGAIKVETAKDVFDISPRIPSCTPDMGLEWVNGALTCVPCDFVVRFGFLYDGLRVCTSRPELECATGDVSTFDHITYQWVCRPQCNNGQYDRAVAEGIQICVPC